METVERVDGPSEGREDGTRSGSDGDWDGDLCQRITRESNKR